MLSCETMVPACDPGSSAEPAQGDRRCPRPATRGGKWNGKQIWALIIFVVMVYGWFTEKAFYNMGISYYKLGRYPDAIDAFGNAVKRHRGFIPGFYRLALSYNANRQYSKASDTLSQAVGLDPRFQGDKHLAESWIKEQKKNEMLSPVEADQFLDILHY